MKQLLVISLSILILSGTSKDVAIYAAFKFNQSYIAEFLCINKEQPQLKCNGKCQLKDQLEESKEKESETPIPFSESKQFPVYLVSLEKPNSDLVPVHDQGIAVSLKTNVLRDGFLDAIFHPPKA